MSEKIDTWLTTVVSQHAEAIRSSNPSRQPPMVPNVRAWKKWFSETPWVLDIVEAHHEAGITREHLHRVAMNSDLSTPEGRRTAFTTTIVWGVGSTNRYYGRHRRLLTSPDLGQALERSCQQLREREAEAAFKVMDPLPGITFRFHTKWLWVAGSALGLQPQPLVLDNRVLSSLKRLKWPEFGRRQSASSRWSRYIEDAAAIAQSLDVSPENVEFWLFSEG